MEHSLDLQYDAFLFLICKEDLQELLTIISSGLMGTKDIV